MALVRQIRADGNWKLKEDGSLLTVVDPANENLLRKELVGEGEYFIGEESIDREGVEYVKKAMDGVTWVVDPIDGTAPFAHGLPLWGISIGQMIHGKLVNGAVALPDLDLVLVTDGSDVFQSVNIHAALAEWHWTKVIPPDDVWNPGKMILLGQSFTKHHLFVVPNPVVCTGSAVQALAWLISGRGLAYVGSMKLWDVAGILPMLDRLGLPTIFLKGGRLTVDVIGTDSFNLDFGSPKCWYLKDTFICAPDGVREHIFNEIGV